MALNANVRFFDHQSACVAKLFIQRADLGLVVIARDVYKYAYPSKTMTYLEQGTPIIALMESESELARVMLSDGYGFSIPNESATELSFLLLRLGRDFSWRPSMRQAALSAFNNRFSTNVVLDKWLNVVRLGHL